MNNIDITNNSVSLECPNCNFQIEILIKQIIAEETIICPGCQRDIKLIDENASFLHANQKINGVLEDFQKAFRKYGGKK